MKAGIVTSISFAALLVLAQGCVNKNQNLYGHWEGARDWKTLGIDNEFAAKGVAAVSVDLNANGTFRVVDMSLPFEGEWVDHGDRVDLTVLTVMNQQIGRQPESTKTRASNFSLRYSNGKLYFKTPTDKEEIELEKKPKP